MSETGSTEQRGGVRVVPCFSVPCPGTCLANQTNTPRFYQALEASSSMFTEDGKICSPFAEQFHVFHQGKVKEKENRAGAHGEILSKVGGRRGTITGPFSTSPFRTVLAPFSAHGSPVDDSHSGSGSYTSRALLPFNCHPPVPLPHVSGITLSS